VTRTFLATSAVLACALAPVSVLVTAPPAAADTIRVIPVPTPNANLGRVTSLPDGTVFFVEVDAGKFGYFGPSGIVSETDLPGTSGPDQVTAFDVAPNGRVWTAVRRPETIVTSEERDGSGGSGLGPQGSTVYTSFRTTADSRAWLAYQGGGTIIIADLDSGGGGTVGAPGSSDCGGLLGKGGDGNVWCTTATGLKSLTPSAAGPVRPVPGGTGLIRAIGPGPAGSTWFARYEGGTLLTGSNGGLGYVDAAGGVHTVNIGARTAPTDLAMGPDGTVWFTSAGDAAGIGHISPDGTGALTALPGYNPQHLTVLPDGTIVATDPVHNVVLAVSPSVLQTTNVDPGAGSVLRPAAARPASAKALRVKKGKVRLRLSCPADAPPAGCAGSAAFATGGTHPKPLSKQGGFATGPGGRATVRLKLNKRGLHKLAHRRVVRLRLAVTVAVSGEVAVFKVKVRRQRH
jgi:virginiamycin B lyase